MLDTREFRTSDEAIAARERGVCVIETTNEEHNPMLKLNRQLGFVPKSAELYMENRSRSSRGS